MKVTKADHRHATEFASFELGNRISLLRTKYLLDTNHTFHIYHYNTCCCGSAAKTGPASICHSFFAPHRHGKLSGSLKRSTNLGAGQDVLPLVLHTPFPQFNVATTQLQYSAMAAVPNGRPIDPTAAKGRPNGQVVGRRVAGKKDTARSLSSKGFGWIAR